MASKQETLIYIEEENIKEAEFMSRSFVDMETKNRAYINALGAELAMKYLASEGIKIENIHNIHSISKILESIDIADILLPNIHIDVRVIWNENQIFIPKSHFELEIKPDIYLVLKLDTKLKYVELLGYFKPQQINLKNCNDKYYFFAKDKLSSPDSLKKFIQNYTGSTSKKISQEDMLRGRELSISLADHNLSIDEQKELLELLFLSDSLRESVLEFDNFETLAYNVASSTTKTKDSAETFTLLNPEDEEQNNIEDLKLDPIDDDTENSFTLLPAEDDIEESATRSLENKLSDTFSDQITIEENSISNNNDLDLSGTNVTEEDIFLDESFFENTTEDNETETSVEENKNEETEDQIENSTETVEDTIIETPTETENINNENVFENISNENQTNELETTEDNNSEIADEIHEDNLIEPNLDEIDLGDNLLDDNIGIQEDINIDTPTDELENIENSNSETFDTMQEDNLIESNLEEIDLGDTLLDDNIEMPEPEMGLAENNLDEDLSQTTLENELPTLSEDFSDIDQDLLSDTPENTLEIDETDGELDTIENTNDETNETETQEQETNLPGQSSTNISQELAQTITSALKESLEKKDNATNVEAGAISAEKTSTDAMKLASVAGDLVNDIVNKNIEEQQKNLDRIDYAKSTTNANDVPEHIAALAKDLSAAKIEINMKEEASGKFETPKDLSELKVVENNHKEQEFEQETIELGDMETVQTEEFTEDTDSIVNLEHLNAIDSPTKPVENLEERTQTPEVDKMDLPDLSTFEIREDGTSTFDNFATDINYNEEEQLIDFNMPSNEIKIDDNETFGFDTTTDISSDLALNDEIFENTIMDTQETLLEEPHNTEETFDTNPDEIISEEIENPASTTFDSEITSDNSDMEDINDFLNDNFEITENPTSETPQESIHQDIISEEPQNDIIEEQDAFLSDIENESPNTPNEIIEEPIINDTAEPQETSQEWLNDTNYDNLEDIEIPQPTQNELSEEDITEPDVNAPKVFAVKENSVAISDRTFKAGEIPIDINYPASVQNAAQGNENLEDLYNPETKVPGSALLQNPGRLGSLTGNNGGFGLGLKLIGGLVTLAVVCAIGFGVAKMFKTPTEETPQPITDDTVPTSPDNGVAETNTLNVNPDNVVKMDNNNNTLATTNTTVTKNPQSQKTVSTNTNANSSMTPAQKKAISSTTFIEVKKLTWEVPDYISYNQHFKQYFQAAGKSLKLSLTSDLLLATDYAYTSEIRVSVTFDKDGTFKNSQIVTSSGSTQIDSIVLQTVNQTLKVLKAPHSVGNDENTTAILKIYL